ncbi:MAG: hypothetical protein IPL61_24190 [Myxococcales bacterium]|nr:hypothetical protein [Myxococcales bacterium]
MTSLPRLSMVALFVAACGGGGDDGGDPPVTGVTWYADVAPILAQHCMGCHKDGGIAPFVLTDYDAAAPIAPQLLEAVEAGIMPPFDARASAGCTPRHGWQDDPRLSAAEEDTLRAWIANGTPAGAVAPVPPPPVYELPGVNRTLAPTTPFVTTGDADQFICFALDPGVTDLTWMTGLQIRAGNPDVVHHAVTVALFPKRAPGDPDGPNEQLRAAGTIGVPFDCADGGVTTMANSFLLGVWTPGNQPIDLPRGVAAPLLARSLIVIQIHYHPGGRLTNAPDATAIDLRLDNVRPTQLYTATAVGNAGRAPDLLPGPADRGAPEFRIPAGSADHRESMRFTIGALDAPLPLFSAYPHMHYVGTGIDVAIARAAPTAAQPADECLYSGDWNFDWQRSYLYDAPIEALPTVATGDVIDVSCTYDNTLRNPFVQRALAEAGLEAPIDVVLGEETLDEMCLGIFGVVVPFPPAARPQTDADVRALLDRAALTLTPR